MDITKIVERQFITLEEVRTILSISKFQAYTLVRSGQSR